MSFLVLIASLFMSEMILTERDLVLKVIHILRVVEEATHPQSSERRILRDPFRKLSLTEMIFHLLETITVLKNNPHLFSVYDREYVRLLFNHLLWERACRKSEQLTDEPYMYEMSPGVFVRIKQGPHNKPLPMVATLILIE